MEAERLGCAKGIGIDWPLPYRWVKVERSQWEEAERRAIAASGCEFSIQRGRLAEKSCCQGPGCRANGSRLRVVTSDWRWLLWRGLAGAEYGDWDSPGGEDCLARHF